MDFTQKRLEAFERLRQCYRTSVLYRLDGMTPKERKPAEAWAVTVEVEVDGEVRDVRLEVRVSPDFPLVLPRIYLSAADRERFGLIPHVDPTGFICTFDTAAVHVNAEAPGELAVECVAKAASLLEAGLNGSNSSDFEDEFLAYWTIPSGDRDVVKRDWLSLIDLLTTGPAYLLELKSPLGPYRNVVHVGGPIRDQFAEALKVGGVAYTEREVFSLGEVPLMRPPFALSNEDVLGTVEALGATDRFRHYVDSCKKKETPTVLFSVRVAGRLVTLGWQLAPPGVGRRGFRKGALKPFGVLSTFERGSRVARLDPERLTPDRMQFRTAGSHAQPARPAVFVAGLGSVGSHLTHLLGSGLLSKLGLLDPDSLKIENVGRHLLGLPHVGMNKAAAMRAHFVDQDPLLPVSVVQGRRLAEALLADPGLLTGYDRLVVAIGDTATELWVGDELAAGRLATPTFFLWVEPHLAAGHCVYLKPGDPAFSTLFDDGVYRWNAIAPEAYVAHTFTEREAGCQTSFVPYAATNVVRFVSAVLPHVLDAALNDVPSFRLTWTGDLNALEGLGIPASERARSSGPFHLEREPLYV